VSGPILSPGALRDIDTRVAKVLADLGSPDPPLHLEDVRELLRLDLQFYASGDPSALDSLVHYVRVGTRRLLERPTRIFDVIRKMSLRAILIPEQRVIFLDENTPKSKHRWDEGHEISHKILEWHNDTLFGDTEFTLSRECHELIEAESNHATARLLFLQDRFLGDLRDVGVGMGPAQGLAKRYRNSLTSTLRRVVESADRPAFLLISRHPRRRSAEKTPDVRYFVPSPTFAAHFPTSRATVFETVSAHCSRARGGIIADFEFPLPDARGEQHVFHFEVFYNKHDALTLGHWVRKHAVVIAV